MRFLLLLLLGANFSINLQAEYFWGPTSENNHLLIATNEAVLVRTTSDFTSGRMSLIIGSSSNRLSGYHGGRIAIAGPAEVVMETNSGSFFAFLSFKRLTNSPIQSMLLRSNESATISVPTGSTIHWLQGSETIGTTLLRSGQSTGYVSIREFDEFEGPLEITIPAPSFNPGLNHDILIAYYFTKNAVALTEPEVIAAPTGSFLMSVESTSDFSNWVPEVLLQKSSDDQKYYRLKVEK